MSKTINVTLFVVKRTGEETYQLDIQPASNPDWFDLTSLQIWVLRNHPCLFKLFDDEKYIFEVSLFPAQSERLRSPGFPARTVSSRSAFGLG